MTAPQICGDQPKRSRSSRTTREAAKAMKVSVRLVELVQFVMRRGIPELVAAIDSDAVKVSQAALIARCDPDGQRELLAMPWRERVAVLKILFPSPAARRNTIVIDRDPAVAVLELREGLGNTAARALGRLLLDFTEEANEG